MAFKSTTNRSHLRLVREVEAIGGSVSASASPEHMCYTYDAFKVYVPEMVEVLIDSVRNPAFFDSEVKEELEKIKRNMSKASARPQPLFLEALHSSGYSGALAKPLVAPASALQRLDSSILQEFIAENYTAPRMVLAGLGVDHDELVSIAMPLLADLPRVKRPEEPKSVYVGGDYRYPADSARTQLSLAFEVSGGWHDEETTVTTTVLQRLMGGGSSFSTGGLGKGMHSQLYRRIVTNYHQIESCAFSSIYNRTGLFVTQEQLDRAKQATKFAVLSNLESSTLASKDMGRQILTYGERKPIESFLKDVEEVTLNDISSVAKKIISSPLTMAAWGDVVHVPSYESVSRKFHSKVNWTSGACMTCKASVIRLVRLWP